MAATEVLRRTLDFDGVSERYVVIADLPKNSTALAARAEEAGVDAILLNIDGEEGSHPNHYGSYDLHDTYINDVISTVSVPCGILIGGGRQLSQEYWERIMSSKFSFVEMYSHLMPLFTLADERVKKVAAITTGYILEQVRQISLIDGVDAVDAAAVPAQSRGSPFSVLDFATLGVVANISTKPVLLRTQKKMTHSDIARVLEQGLRGFVIDPCVLSGTEEAYKDELLQYRPAMPSSDAIPQIADDRSGSIVEDVRPAAEVRVSDRTGSSDLLPPNTT
jgi:hypothetical protein